MRCLQRAALLAMAIGLAPVADAGRSSAQPAMTAEVSIPNTRNIEFVSKVNGHKYGLSVAIPMTPPPPEGYDVLYLLDGDGALPIAAGYARNFNAPNLVTVGIRYPHDPAYLKAIVARRGRPPAFLEGLPLLDIATGLERAYDLTLPATDAELAAGNYDHVLPEKSQNVGGLDDFLKIIETEVKPRVQARWPINRRTQGFSGCSFGGLAVLHALFQEPGAFRTYLICSPTIYWNNEVVLKEEAQFSRLVTAGKAQPRVLITVGAQESTTRHGDEKWGVIYEDAVRFNARIRMVANAVDLARRLESLQGQGDYHVEHAVFDRMAHSQAGWPAIALGISFAFGGPDALGPARNSTGKSLE